MQSALQNPILFFCNLLLLLVLSSTTTATQSVKPDPTWYHTTDEGETEIQLYFFWSRYCKHCAQARPYVQALAREHAWLRLRSMEVGDSRANTLLYIDLAKSLGQTASAVPGFLFCGEMHVGYSNEREAFLNERLAACHQRLEDLPATRSTSNGTSIKVPLLGDIEPSTASLPLLTVTLAGVDAFNPCAFFVLLFLLSLMVHARSRARMALVGAVFVLVSGLFYFLFMAAWLNTFLLFGELRIVTLIAGLAALVIGTLNIKDYFWFDHGPSLSITAGAKRKLAGRMRELVSTQSLLPMLSATLLLAIAANSYELLCTAGFPMVFSRILTLNALSSGSYYGYLLLYNLVYIIPLAVIVVMFVTIFGSRKLSERSGRVLKLFSGSMMALLGALLMFSPQQLASALVALSLVLTALSATVVIEAVRCWRTPG